MARELSKAGVIRLSIIYIIAGIVFLSSVVRITYPPICNISSITYNTNASTTNNSSIVGGDSGSGGGQHYCVSVSLFGSKEKVKKYERPSLHMIDSMVKYLSGWEFHLHFDSATPPSTPYFESIANKNLTTQFFPQTNQSIGRTGCFWRFESHQHCDVVIFRDIELPFTD